MDGRAELSLLPSSSNESSTVSTPVSSSARVCSWGLVSTVVPALFQS